MALRIGRACAVLLFALICIQGIRHHWRLQPVQGTRDCRTGEILDDGCNMLGTCLKCGYACVKGTEDPLRLADGCGR